MIQTDRQTGGQTDRRSGSGWGTDAHTLQHAGQLQQGPPLRPEAPDSPRSHLQTTCVWLQAGQCCVSRWTYRPVICYTVCTRHQAWKMDIYIRKSPIVVIYPRKTTFRGKQRGSAEIRWTLNVYILSFQTADWSFQTHAGFCYSRVLSSDTDRSNSAAKWY